MLIFYKYTVDVMKELLKPFLLRNWERFVCLMLWIMSMHIS